MSYITSGTPTSGPGSGTVTSISAGNNITLTPNPITTTGTVALTIPLVLPTGGISANGGTISLATDATASTINIGTGAGAKTSSFGSTNTTSSTVISSGSGNIVLNTGLSVDSIGRTTNTKQPAFFAYPSADQVNVTGDATTYTVTFNTEVFDQGNNFNTGTGAFVAPVSGTYFFNIGLDLVAVDAAHTGMQLNLVIPRAPDVLFNILQVINPAAVAAGGEYTFRCTAYIYLNASESCTITLNVSGGTKTIIIAASDPFDYWTFFSGYLVS